MKHKPKSQLMVTLEDLVVAVFYGSYVLIWTCGFLLIHMICELIAYPLSVLRQIKK